MNSFSEKQAEARKCAAETPLAVADGQGRNGVWLARQGHHVTSVDFSPVGVEKADRAGGESPEWVRTCTIIPGEPNELAAPIHDRMPVIPEPSTWGKWLGDEPAEREELQALLMPPYTAPRARR